MKTYSCDQGQLLEHSADMHASRRLAYRLKDALLPVLVLSKFKMAQPWQLRTHRAHGFGSESVQM